MQYPIKTVPYGCAQNKVYLDFTDDKPMEFKDSFYLLTQFFDKFLALPLDNILGVFKLESITPIPNNKNKYLLGVTNAKGHVVPVIDLKLGGKIDPSNLLVVFDTPWGKKAGVFEKIEEVISLSKEDLEKAKIQKEPIPYLELVKNSKEIILVNLEDNLDLSKLVEAFSFQFSKAS